MRNLKLCSLLDKKNMEQHNKKYSSQQRRLRWVKIACNKADCFSKPSLRYNTLKISTPSQRAPITSKL